MAVNLSPYGGVGAQFFDNAGNVLTGGKIETYAAGTTTPQATYTSSVGVTFHPNPIILDASGRVPSGGEIWLTDGLSYKFVLKNSNNVLIATYDNVTGINSNFVNFVNQQEIQTATAGQTVFTLTTTNYSPGTNSLSVFVDGVNQYGPGAQYAYLETNSTTVTFVNGLHVGAEVKFTTSQLNSSGATAAAQVSFTGFKNQAGTVQDLADDDGSDWIGFEPAGVGAVAISAQDKMRQIVNVKDFGAVGDGVADDTVAIQAALDASYAVDFGDEANIYRTTTNLILRSGNYVIGNSAMVRIDAGVTTNNNVFLGETVNNVTINGLVIDCNNNVEGTFPYNLAAAILIRGGPNNIVISNNKIYNADFGVIAGGADSIGCRIENNYFQNVGQSIDTFGHGYLILGNICEGGAQGQPQIIFEPASTASIDEFIYDDANWVGNDTMGFDVVIANNVIRGNNLSTEGIRVQNTSAGVIISNNAIANCVNYGIRVAYKYLKQCIVTNNTVRNISGTPSAGGLAGEGIGILVARDGLEPAEDIIVSNNIVSGTTGYGIGVFYSERFIVSNNIVSFSNKGGIGFLECTGGQVIGNQTYNMGLNGANDLVVNTGIFLQTCSDIIVSQNYANQDTTNRTSAIRLVANTNRNIQLEANYNKGTFAGVSTDGAFPLVQPRMVGVLAVPTTGTWNQGDVAFHTDRTAGQEAGWTCLTSGTFSAASTTGDSTNASNVLSGVASTTAFNVNDYVSISAGFATTGPFKVLGKTSTTIWVNALATSGQSGVSITTPDPTFESFA